MSFSTKKCLICQERYLPTAYHQKYCSSACNAKAWRQRDPEQSKKAHQLYKEANKEKIAEDGLKWQRANKDQLKEYRKDPLNHLAANLRSRLSKAISRKQLTCSAVDDLGCTIEELKKYLENKFKPGMSWDNYSLYGWHIDHIKPLILATSKTEIKDLCHYTNLQPLWAEENLSKGDKV
jgi:hypothetical protein